ncbi:hypothetical protein C6A85_10195, partial [Mycobacterium sp. ITM-2017-0098]
MNMPVTSLAEKRGLPSSSLIDTSTSSWTLIELLRHPDYYAQVQQELDDLYSDGQEVSFHALRQIP